MKITSQEEYGLRCLLRLARNDKDRSLTIPEIAAAERLSVPYVGKLLSVLRQSGLIESVRGRAGGYRLAAPPAEISLGAVLRALGEPLFDEPIFCGRHPGTETADGKCVHLGACTLRELWLTLEGWMRRALDRITLAELVRNEGQLPELLRSRLSEAVLEPPTTLIPSLTLTLNPRGPEEASRAPEFSPGAASTK
jgi:Rrf2 family protein